METLWKNNLTFVEDMPMIYVNSTIIAFTVSEKKKREAILSY
jgi:hypothetical protein